VGDDARRRWRGGEAALGGLLLLLGTLVLLGPALQLDLGRVGWPFFMIVPGLGLLGLGLATPGRLGGDHGRGGAGGPERHRPVRHLGLRLDLVFLVGAGIGRWLSGVVRGRGELAASAAWLIAAGLVGFLGLAVVFEVAVGLSGHRSGAAGRYVLAALLILAGLGLVGCRLLTARQP
jgi:hypothetical protein